MDHYFTKFVTSGRNSEDMMFLPKMRVHSLVEMTRLISKEYGQARIDNS